MFKLTRSFQSIIVEQLLKAVSFKETFTAEGAKNYMEKRAQNGDALLKINIKKYKNNASITDYHGMKVITFGNKELANYTIIYIHGGGYVNEILQVHLNFCEKLSKKINGYIIIPLYPLLPENNYEKTYELITQLYCDLLDKKRNSITIMGDSAGGGFAIAFCQYLQTLKIKEPDKLIVFSPWVDVSMSGKKYTHYIKKDPLLGIEGLKIIGKAWSGHLGVKSPLVSPIFGNNIGLPEMLIFVGTHEIFYPDIIDFYRKLLKDNIDVQLIVGNKMNHVYPLLPIPEAKKAMKQIVEKIKT